MTKFEELNIDELAEVAGGRASRVDPADGEIEGQRASRVDPAAISWND